MRIDVFFGPQQLVAGDSSGRVVAVIDVLRASTTIAAALHHGAKAVIPFESSEAAVLRSKSFERGDVKLAGERRMVMIPGFDFGNSPSEFTREAIEGKTVLLATTNGTPALTAVQGARDVVVASYVNFSVVCAMMRAALRGGTDVAIVCAGSERQFSLEDAACAGQYAQQIARGLVEARLNDAAYAAVMIARRFGDNRSRLFEESEHGKALVDAGFAADLQTCASVDAYPVVPVYSDRQITKVGPERER
ncbi:MAG: 2-phosphosulfolactate phosphatase family protein [Gemmatimonadaceae bacterium]